MALTKVTNSVIAERAVFGNNIGLFTIAANNIANGATLVGANSIHAGEIVPDTLTANLFTAGSVETAAIADSNITGAKLATSTITLDKLGSSVNTAIFVNSTITKTNTGIINVEVFNATHIALGNVAGAATINTQQGTYFSANTSGACTWTFAGGPDSSRATAFTLELTGGGGNTGAAYTQTWPAAVKWQSGSAPTLTRGEEKVDVLVFITDDGGTTWRGAVSIFDSR